MVYSEVVVRLVQHVPTPGTNNQKSSLHRWEQMSIGDTVKRHRERTLSVLCAWGTSRKLLTDPGHHQSRVPKIEYEAWPETQFTSKQKARTNRDSERSSDMGDAWIVTRGRC